MAYAEEQIVLNRRGKDVAALVSMEDLLLLQVLEDKLDNEAAEIALQEPGFWLQSGERLQFHVQYDLSQVRRSAKEIRSKPLYDSASPQP